MNLRVAMNPCWTLFTYLSPPAGKGSRQKGQKKKRSDGKKKAGGISLDDEDVDNVVSQRDEEEAARRRQDFLKEKEEKEEAAEAKKKDDFDAFLQEATAPAPRAPAHQAAPPPMPSNRGSSSLGHGG